MNKRISVLSKAGAPLLLRDYDVFQRDMISRCWRCREDQEYIYSLNFGGSLNIEVDVCKKCGLVSVRNDGLVRLSPARTVVGLRVLCWKMR